MFNRYFRSTLASFLLLLCSIAHAQMKVHIVATTEDNVGNRLVYAIKEGIRRSASMELVDREEDGLIRLNIVTLDPDKTGGDRTIYSIVWTVQTLHDTPVTMYLTSSVGICGSSRVAQCADGLVANTDRESSKIRSWIRSMLEQNKK